MVKKEILKVIQDEIKWCKENKETYLKSGKRNAEDYAAGFIGGLKQAKRLIDLMKAV